MKSTSMLVAVALASSPLAAQQPGGEGSMMREAGPAVMKMMLYMPQHLLARKDALGLTPDQVTRLTALRDGVKTAHEAAEAEAQAHIKELDQAANAPQPDTVALKTHFQAAHAAMGKVHWLALATAVQARSVLNDAQRQKLAVWADSMQAWMHQHRQMMQPSPHN
jgi:heavy-metal resistance protein